MLNYIHAEFYKLLRRPYTYITLGVMLLLEGLLVAGFTFHNSHSFATPFGKAVVMIAAFGSIGLVTCLLTGDIVFAGQYKNSTLKNEVSFGLSRTHIYLGKLIAQVILSLLYMVIMLGGYITLCAVLLPHNLEGFPTDTEAFVIVGYFLGVSIPLWIGAQAAACMCQFLINGDTASSFAYVGLVFVLGPFIEVMGYLVHGQVGDALLEISAHFPEPLMKGAGYVVGELPYLGKAWLVGAAWVAVCTAIGLYGFNRKEIK